MEDVPLAETAETTMPTWRSEERAEIREALEDMRTLWADHGTHGDRHKAWRDFSREVTFETYKDWAFDDGKSSFDVHDQTLGQARRRWLKLVGLLASEGGWREERTSIEFTISSMPRAWH